MGPGLLALGAAAALLRGAHAHAQKNSTCSTLVEDSCWYNPGPHVVATLKGVQTAAECCAACDKNPRCLAFTLNMGDSRTCYLKDGLAIQPHPGNCTSGGTILPTPPPPPTPPPGPAPPHAKSVLFIAIDDLRPELGAYGSHVPTPHLDAFAKEALVFTNAYIQYSFCCPSRNSFMTGRRREHSHPTTPPHPRSLGRACNKQAQQNPRLELHRAQPSHPCPACTFSLPTGRVWLPQDHFREPSTGENWVSFPEWFKQHGYFTHGLGKLYHPSKRSSTRLFVPD